MTETADYPDRPDPLPDGWLTDAELAAVRSRLPILYVDAVPVRVDECGDVIAVGLLLRINGEGIITRSLVSGRVMYHERVRDALLRHLEKDLGPVALPQIPPSPQPFTVAEYLPTSGVTPYHDARQHAVALAFVVPVAGDCEPQQDALELTWMAPEDACAPHVQREMSSGHAYLLRQAMAHLGRML
jgi:ADP-ribose pyrophosphatase YjhB (NUDIX family)